VVGGVLVVSGLRRRSIPGFAMALVGGGLLARALLLGSRLEEDLDLPTSVRSEDEEGEAGRTKVSRSVTVGKPTEAHGTGRMGLADSVKQDVHLEADRPHVLRQAIRCCRKGGTLSVPGVYLGHADNIPVSAIMNKALTVKTGQTHVQRYLDPLLERIESGEIDPSFVVTHDEPLEKGPEMYGPSGRRRTAVSRSSCGPEPARRRHGDTASPGPAGTCDRTGTPAFPTFGRLDRVAITYQTLNRHGVLRRVWR